MLEKSTAVAVVVAAVALAACGGGGGTKNAGPLDQGPPLNEVQILTGAAPPAETYANQEARAHRIVSRTNSLLTTTLYGETSSREAPTFRASSSCFGTTCTATSDVIDLAPARVSDFEFIPNDAQTIGTKHRITVFRWVGRHDQTDYRTLGAWMDHSFFGVQAEGLTIDGVRIDARAGIALGDLSETRPAENTRWQGTMVGMLATGSGRGDRLVGNATLSYDMRSESLDAAFTDIQNIDRLQAHTTAVVRFNDISVDSSGKFRAGLTGNRIQGGFYGTGHPEAAGVFERGRILGAFGAKR